VDGKGEIKTRESPDDHSPMLRVGVYPLECFDTALTVFPKSSLSAKTHSRRDLGNTYDALGFCQRLLLREELALEPLQEFRTLQRFLCYMHRTQSGRSGSRCVGRNMNAQTNPITDARIRVVTPAKWRTNVPTYSKVKYEGIYSGIDGLVRHRGTERNLP
jgi:hypothetical protein